MFLHKRNNSFRFLEEIVLHIDLGDVPREGVFISSSGINDRK